MNQDPVFKSVAFNYAALSTTADLEYYAKFDLVVTGAILAADQLKVVRSQRARLVQYQWSSALYPNEGGAADLAWQNLVVRHASSWLLSSKPLGGGAAASPKTALWYDFGSPEFSSAFASHICDVIGRSHYHGVFLDTLGFPSLPEAMQKEFRRRHGSLDYDQCQGEFLSKLRKGLGSAGIVFTNQGYRNPKCFLPHADLDLIESSSTLIKSDGSMLFRAWSKPGSEWDSIKLPMHELVMPASRSYPRTQFVQMNYVQGDRATCDRAIAYGFACAKLWDQISYVAPPGVQHALLTPLYFTELGEPIAAYEEDTKAGTAWRRYQKGVVAINSSNKEYKISSLGLVLSNPPNGYTFLNTK